MTPVYDIKNLQNSILHYWPPAGAQTHGPSTTDKKFSALSTPLLGPAETNTHIGFLGCIHLISEWILYCNINSLVDTGCIQSKIPRSERFVGSVSFSFTPFKVLEWQSVALLTALLESAVGRK